MYQKDFDGIKRKFLSLHLRISKILANSDHVTLENLKELLAFYSELEGPLQAAETITSVMRYCATTFISNQLFLPPTHS